MAQDIRAAESLSNKRKAVNTHIQHNGPDVSLIKRLKFGPKIAAKFQRNDQLLLSGGTDSMVNLWRVSSISSAPLIDLAGMDDGDDSHDECFNPTEFDGDDQSAPKLVQIRVYSRNTCPKNNQKSQNAPV